MTYSDKLRNPRWQKRRLQILARDAFTCALCGDTETELHVHHNRYTAYGTPPWLYDDEDLVTLCAHCHLVVESTKGTSEIKKILKFKNHESGLVLIITINAAGSLAFNAIDPGDRLYHTFLSVSDEKMGAILNFYEKNKISNG